MFNPPQGRLRTCLSLGTILASVILALALLVDDSTACNEAVCGSIVSKCQLTQSCRCEGRKNEDCACCKECFNCLGLLYSECCSCVGMCPMPNETYMASSRQSQIGTYNESLKINGLFKSLTEQPDTRLEFKVISFPVDFDIFTPKKEIKYQLQSIEQDVLPTKQNITTLNCTVIFLRNCMSWNSCYKECESFGATSYRWFLNGCCECVGDTCINSGIDDSRCPNCPLNENDTSLDNINEDDFDYGEGMTNEDDDFD